MGDKGGKKDRDKSAKQKKGKQVAKNKELVDKQTKKSKNYVSPKER